MSYKHNQFGIERTLEIGQKVECIYYHEDIQWKENKETWRSLVPFMDAPFTPVKLGIIVGDAGNRPYYLSFGNGQQFLYVKFKEYRFAKAIPISCIKDAKQSALEMQQFISDNSHKVGQKGYSVDSVITLSTMAHNAMEFTK